jgi:hypothetical protein
MVHPGQLGPEEIRARQLFLLREKSQNLFLQFRPSAGFASFIATP